MLHLLLTGASPFLEETEDETAGSVLRCDLSFPAEPWAGLSSHAKDLVSRCRVLVTASFVLTTSSSPRLLVSNPLGHCHRRRRKKECCLALMIVPWRV
jgi:hypothetical protein